MSKCPRCGNRNIKESKITLLGKGPDVAPGVRLDDIVVYGYYCSNCELLEEGSTSDDVKLNSMVERWTKEPEFERPIAWARTGDAHMPFEASVNGQVWKIRTNEYVGQGLYTLIVNNQEQFSFDHWPLAWSRSSKSDPRRVLRYVGTFRELGGEDDAAARSLSEARGQRTASSKYQVVEYLRSGKRLFVSPGLDDDIFDPSWSETRVLKTDGAYVWFGILARYVEKYDVALPQEFEDHMASVNWTIDESIDTRQLVLPGDVDA